MSRGLLFAVLLIPFVVLATFNSAGYRYGASDLAFYAPAVLERLDPALFPRDSEVIESQATLTAVDETVAAAARVLSIAVPSASIREGRTDGGRPRADDAVGQLPVLFAVLYVAALALLLWGVLSVASSVYRSMWAAVALVAAMTLRHAITKTGTNTLEGYFHPRQLAFACGVAALAVFLRRGVTLPGVLLLAGAAFVHPTTALWFIVWLGVAAFLADPKLRAPLALAGGAGAIAGVWALSLGPLQGRLAPMDPAWLETLATKDYLFPLRWPLSAWIVNLAYAPLIVWIFARRRNAGLATPREWAVVTGCLSLLIAFAGAVALHAWPISLAIQLQPARIFWMLDFLATVYVVWALAEGTSRVPRPGRAAAVAGVIIALTAGRSAYVATVRFPERSFATIQIPDTDWGRAMAWARSSSDKSSGWLADPVHAARYGTSVRVAAHRDVFVEEIKDTAIGMYSRPVAMRTRERLDALGHFGDLNPAHARALAAEYDLAYLVTEQQLDLPVAYQSGSIRVYRLR